MPPPTGDQVFISYSHKDAPWRDDLDTHLKPYLHGSSIVSWSDQKIAPGAEWFSEVQSALANSKVAVLLVSPDFLASDFIHDHELGPLLNEAKRGGVKLLWVPIRDSAYKQTALKNYQAVLDPGIPLAKMEPADRDSAWVKVCEEIEKAANSNASKKAFPGNKLRNALSQLALPRPDRLSNDRIDSAFQAVWRHISPTLKNDLRESIKLTEEMRAAARNEHWQYSLSQPYPKVNEYHPHLALIRQYDRLLWKCFTAYIRAAWSSKSLAHQYNNALYAALHAEDTGNRKPPEEGLRRQLHKSALKLESLADELSERQAHYDVVTFSSPKT
jgi:hypothetical protein